MWNCDGFGKDHHFTNFSGFGLLCIFVCIGPPLGGGHLVGCIITGFDGLLICIRGPWVHGVAFSN